MRQEVLPLLAAEMLNISYHGTGALATVAFDENGGTNTEGRFTFTVDGSATTVDCDSYNTLATLVPQIDGLTGWACKATPGLLSTMSTEKSGLTQRVVGDLPTTTVDKSGVRAMIFTNDYEVMPASATTALISSVGIPVGHALLVGLNLSIDGADGAAAGDGTFNFVNNPLGAANALPGIFPASDYEAAWDTDGYFGTAPVLAINGATEVTKTIQQETYGMMHMKLLSVTNGDDAVLNVKGTVKKVM
jgi:hypothetical protein